MAEISVLTVSEKGLVRENNEDHLHVEAAQGVFAVADGMGGGSEGERASEMVCEELATVSGDNLKMRRAAAEQAIVSANRNIRAYARKKGFRQMGSTVALLLSDPGSSDAWVGHVGDSRVYRIRNGVAECRTEDHTVGAQLLAVAKGAQAEALRSRAHPLAHILTRVIGGAEKVEIDWCETELAAGDRFLICSDGVHDVTSDEEIGRLVGKAQDLATAAQDLEDFVVRRGAPDNYSFVLGEVRS